MLQEQIALFVSLSGVISIIGGGLAWYRSSVQKSYAAERAFGHLEKSIQQLSANLATLSDELDSIDRTILEQKMVIQAIYGRMEAISAHLGAVTSGWKRPE